MLEGYDALRGHHVEERNPRRPACHKQRPPGGRHAAPRLSRCDRVRGQGQSNRDGCVTVEREGVAADSRGVGSQSEKESEESSFFIFPFAQKKLQN